MLRKLKELVYMNRYPQLSASELEALREDTNEVMLLPSSNDYGWFTSFESGESYISNAEVITLGRARYANIKYCNCPFISSNNHIIETKDKNQLRTRYLYNFLSYTSKTYYVESTSYPKFEKDIFENTTLDVPKISVQDARINELDYLNNAISEEKRRLSEFDSLIKSRFNEFDSLIKSRFNEQFISKPSFLTKKRHEVLNIINGRDYKGHEGTQYPIYGSGGFMGIYANNFLASGILTIIGRKGTIDRPLLVNGEIWNIDTAFAIKTNDEILNPVFFHYRSKFYDYQNLNKQTTKPSLRKSDLLKLDIEIPPMAIQLEFIKLVEIIDKLKFNCQQRIKLYQELLDKKMDEYFG